MTSERLGQTVRKRAAGSAWRGLSMTYQGGTTIPGTNAAVVQWDTLLAETDGIRSTGVLSPGGLTVDTGAAGVVPAGMAGLWRLASKVHYGNGDGTHGNYQFNMIVNNFDLYLTGFYEPFTAEPGDFAFDLICVPVVVPLAEGDIVWALAQAPAGCFIDFGLSPDLGCTFLMEFVGT